MCSDNYKRVFMARRNITEYEKYISDDERSEILKFADSWNSPAVRMVIHFMDQLGIRVSEACIIKISDIDFNERVVNVTSTKQKKIIKRIMSDKLITILQKHISDNSDLISLRQGFICATLFGHGAKRPHITKSAIMNFFLAFRNQRDDKGEYFIRKDGRKMTRFSSHVLRSHFITRLYEATGNLRIVQLEIGHKKLETTSRYVRYANRKGIVREALSKMS